MKSTFLLVFIDGLGIGLADRRRNPCAHEGFRYFNRFLDAKSPPLPFGGCWRGLDAAMGVAGTPQSATGQTAFMTGENAAALLGRHLNGLPNAPLRDLLQRRNLFAQLRARHKAVAFLNAYRPEWFVIDAQTRLRFASVTTIACMAAALPFFTVEDVRERKCLYQEFTNQALQQRGIAVPRVAAETAGHILAQNAMRYDFAMYEYFQTDRAGHRASFAHAIPMLLQLETLLDETLRALDLRHNTVLLISDHGNLEDLSVKSHTRNPALALMWGARARELSLQLRTLCDVYSAVTALC